MFQAIVASIAIASAPGPALVADIEALAHRHDVPAVAIALIDGGETSFVSTGVLDRETMEPVDEKSVFQIASISKVMTGIVANHLVEEGVLAIDKPIIDVFPEIQEEREGERLSDIEVRNLLHHTSGLPRDFPSVDREGNDPMLAPVKVSDAVADLARAELLFEPGTQYSYSNFGYGILGMLMTRVSGRSYGELLDEVVVDPLGLEDTGIARELTASSRAVRPYRKEDGRIPTSDWNTGVQTPASGNFSTASDLAKILAVQLADYRSGGSMVVTDDTFAVSKGRRYGYGLNVQEVERDGEALLIHYHSGDMDGFAGFYAFVPERNKGFVLLVSRGGEGKEALQGLLLQWMLEAPE